MKENAVQNLEDPKTLEAVQNYAIGEWESLSVELRPTGRPHRKWQYSTDLFKAPFQLPE